MSGVNVELNATHSIHTGDDVVILCDAAELIDGRAGINGERGIEVTADRVERRLTVDGRGPRIPDRLVAHVAGMERFTRFASAVHVRAGK